MDINQATETVLLHLKDFLNDLPEQFKESPHLPSSQTPSHLIWMIDTLLENPHWPIDKKSRWLGFIQGVCACHFGLDVDEERNFTRPLFHQAYSNTHQDIPQTKAPPTPNTSFAHKKSVS